MALRFNRMVVTPARDREALEQAITRGSEQLKLGKLSEAQRQFRVALEHDAENTRVLALLGLTYFRGNQYGEARPIYESLVERLPTDASHRLNLGLVYLKLNESDLAISSLEASRALDPSQGRAVSYLGLAYARAGRYAEAYRSFLMAGQNELASEIEINLTAQERDSILGQLGRPVAAPTAPRTRTPEPRTRPPSAPPRRITQDGLAAQAGFAEPQLSSPEIVIEKLTSETPSVPMMPARSGASVIELSASGNQPRATDSMQFVLPRAEAAPQPMPGESMVSMAVAAAAPTAAAAQAVTRTPSGGLPPRPLSEIATDDLIRPEEGADPFEITPSGALIIRVADRVLTRLDGIHVSGGDLSYELAMRRSRGHQTDERFDYNATPLHTVSGRGYLVAVPAVGTTQSFLSVVLDDDILYLREDLVFAFEATLRWESGNVPGLRGKLPVVQFRGDGALAARLIRPLVRVKLPAQGVVFVDADRLAGWIGRVIPRAVVSPTGGPLGTMCVECTGEGVVLIEPAPEGAPAHVAAAPLPRAPTVASEKIEPAPPPAEGDAPPPPPREPSPPDDPDAAIEGLDRIDEM